MTLETNRTISRDLDTVKELYGQLFLLLEQAVEEDPLARASAQLDLAIRQLTHVIDVKMVPFREEVRQARQSGVLSPENGEAIAAFESSLVKGLTIMRDCVGIRSRDIARQRDEIRSKLKKVHHKKSGMKGYAIPRMGGNFIESDI